MTRNNTRCRWASIFLPAFLALATIATAGIPMFRAGDRVTFIGDSITHGGSYHAAIYLFHATRFPDRLFLAYNCGISGDTAPGTNRRFDWDIAVHEPTVATVLLGMNDAWAWCFDAPEPTEAMRQGRIQAYSTYTNEMTRLAAALDALHCRIIFIKPSPYDQTARIREKNLPGKDDLLKRFGDFLDTLAAQHGGFVVDFHEPLLPVNRALQAKDPAATVIGYDRVHPGAPGHFVMAWAFLRAENMPRLVSALEVDAASGRIRQQENFTVHEGAEIAPDRVAFTCFERALPFPVTDEQREALEWIPFEEQLNQQLLKVTGLQPGTYELRIDGITVGAFSSAQLARGINLADNPATPQHQQAIEVRAVNERRLAPAAKLRALAHVRHTMLRKIQPPVDEDDPEALAAALDAHVEQSQGKPWYGYLKSQARLYLEALPREKTLHLDEDRQMERMWCVNQPRPHRWTLTRQDAN